MRFSAFLKKGIAITDILLALRFKSTTVGGMLKSVSILYIRLLLISILCNLKHEYTLSGKMVIWLLLKFMAFILLQDLKEEGMLVSLLF